jgi:hypothetical protein
MRVPRNETALLQPRPVITVGNVIPDPQHQDQHQAKDESEGDVVVEIFRELRQRGKCIGANHRFDNVTAVKRVEAGQPQNDERDRRQPVAEPVDEIEPLYPLARWPFFDADAPPDGEEQGQQDNHPQHAPGAPLGQRPVVDGAPGFA